MRGLRPRRPNLMKNKNSLIARILALTALVGAVAVVFVVVNSETGGDESAVERKATGNGSGGKGGDQNQQPAKKVYVVEEGDTLTAIARKNGVPVARIEELNPEIDPQALIPGQKLKLR